MLLAGYTLLATASDKRLAYVRQLEKNVESTSARAFEDALFAAIGVCSASVYYLLNRRLVNPNATRRVRLACSQPSRSFKSDKNCRNQNH